jgi:heme a synthase
MTPYAFFSVALTGLALALLPLCWVGWRQRTEGLVGFNKALLTFTLFLTFDLIVFGAFTRLTDSGLGCPDWPGCYGSASPLGAQAPIAQAQAIMPTGPVTVSKAWIEMIHRYLATGVGVLITAMVVSRWVAFRRQQGPGMAVVWAAVTWVWVCLQGAFGALTVTMKLYPAIVTAHLLGGLVLLMLLVAQTHGVKFSHGLRFPSSPEPLTQAAGARLSPGLRWGLRCALLLTLLQASLGGWVSTNYAVLACQDFPLCQGKIWPPMNFAEGFALARPLGLAKNGEVLSFSALTAIHMVHRLGALVLTLVLGALIWRLFARATLHRWAWALSAVLVWQLLSGLSNVVLGWPLLAALAHTAGAAALLGLLVSLMVRV